MNSAHCLLFLTNAFLWMLPVIYGHPDQLPEIIEDTNEDSSTCYGTLKQFQPSCSHRPGTVIGVQAVKVGAKRTSLNCPENVPDAEARNDTCCTANTTTDCIQVFDYMKSFIPEKYKYHNLCSGYPECTKSAETVWAQTDCDNSTAEYMKNTNYMFMEFSCIQEFKIRNMCSDQSYTGSTVYIQSPEYPGRNISADINKCTCHVTSTADITMYTLDVRLYGQKLTVANQADSTVYNESNSTMFNITSTVLTGGDIWVTLNTSSTDDGAYVWIGFEAMNLSSLTISCKVYGPEDIEEDTSSPVAPIVSTVPQNPGPSTRKSTNSKPRNGPGIALIIGFAVGLLLVLLFVVMVCYLVKRKKRNDDRKRKISTLMKDDKDSEISRNARRSFDQSRAPMNQKFKASSIYSNRVEPTRYIEEHGGIRSNAVLPDINRSSRRIPPDQGNNFTYQPSRLPPLTNANTDVFKSVNESSYTEHRDKKKSKKRKSHKNKKKDFRNGEVREARSPGTADVYNDKRHSDYNERRSSDTNERRRSDTNERRYTDTNERRRSDTNERGSSDTNERRYSDTNERGYSDTNERRYSDTNERGYSDTNERRVSDTNERRHSKERKHRRHSSKKSQDGF